jgi:pimeloyl-ACP methyl ester carboxylesterase
MSHLAADRPTAFPTQYRSEDARRRADASYDAILARWPVPCEARFVATRLGPTHVVSSGPHGAPPLVLLHGLGTNATSWFPVVAALSARRRVHAVDTIGDLGKSAGTRPTYESGDHSRWLAEVLGGLGVRRALLAGLSAGGWIALRFALAHPERVERLALLAPASLQPMRAGMILRGAFAMIFPARPVLRSLFRALAGGDPAPVMPEWAMDDHVLRWRLSRPSSVRVPLVRDGELSALTVPTLLLLGERDPFYGAAEAAARVRRANPRIAVRIVPRAGHVLPSQRPEETAGALLDFFEGREGAGTGGPALAGGA